ncbi:MAG: hypothetical protein HYZ53_09485 [Planctomycetes bacterium]|nr:hypothetical protein [Planctomycetota bacterium]
MVSLVGVGLSAMPNEATWVTKEKAVLWPLRAPWVHGPVLIPGDSLKGLLRHELGAILGAPMERVAERSYSYRPNSLYVDPRSGPRLVARIARIPAGAVQRRSLDPKDPDSPKVSVPTSLELLSLDLRYDRDHALPASWYRFDPRVGGGDPYRGGQGAGATLNSKKRLHRRVGVNPSGPTTSTPVPIDVIEGYLHTLRHLTDTQYGHFSERHPDVGTTLSADAAGAQILQAAQSVVFQPGDLIWVEWDTVGEGRIVSFGWHYYYRWAYQDTVRHVGWRYTRRAGLFPLPDELQNDPANLKLSAVRRLFGYTGDNAGSKDIGRGDPNHSQLMGRLFVNAALELVSASDTDETRFLKPTFLKELGMPRPSAVEHYLKQPHHPGSRPCDNASLVTYGDAAGYDTPGTLAGRKFYLDRPDAYTGTPWAEDSPANRLNDRSTLALQASAPQRPFRFTLRFRDLDAAELVAVLLAFCPNQFGKLVNGKHPDGYCSKLGYARPLGWGSVRIEAKEMLLLDTDTAPDAPALKPEHVASWFQLHLKELQAAKLPEWLAIHRHKHPDAADYPRPKGQPNGPIYTYHTQLRAEHSRLRRYPPRGR